MSESREVNLPAGMAAEGQATSIGPLESRRARRARSEAAVAALELPIADPEDESVAARSEQTTVVFSDELSVARRQKLIAIADAEPTPILDEGPLREVSMYTYPVEESP